MENWHATQCHMSDIAVVPELNVPACMSCGEICTSRGADNKLNDELQIPSAGKRSAMQLNWPPSMPYQNYAYSYDPDGSLHKTLASLVDQEWGDKGTDKQTSCSSVIKTVQTPSSQVSKTAYQSLDGTKIRVLRLYKGRFGDCLHGDFQTVSLQSRDTESEEPEASPSVARESVASYEAVSYTWAKGNGKRDKDHAIFIGNRWDMLPITENCYDALQNCRFQDQDRCLWVDAICINQSNVSERTHQVGMMRRIYSSASRVLIYLGTDGSEFTHDPEILSENPYFSRIWVVQEIASAKQALVLYHRQAMHWSFFHRNLLTLSSKRWMQHFGSPRQINDPHEFLTLIEDTRDCNASDPRDKIFPLLGLWKKPLEPDYTLSPQAVYTGLASALITDDSWEVVVQLLDMATYGRSMFGLPSWVPDWSEKSQRSSQRDWRRSFPFPSPHESQPNDAGKFRVHGQTGSLCILAAEIDIMAPYLSCGLRSTSDGMVTVEAGCFQISLASEVLRRCEPTDRICRLSQYKFCLILRKKAEPDIYVFQGLCGYSRLQNSQNQPIEVDAIRYLQDWSWLLSLGKERFWSKFATWEKTQICWLALRRQRGLETRIRLRRLIRKAQYLKQLSDLAREERNTLNSYINDKDRLRGLFQRQRLKTFKRWQQADKLLVVSHREWRYMIRKSLPGYRSLELLQETSTQPLLRQSMWLPLSSCWFENRMKPRSKEMPIYLDVEYPMLATCVSRNLPLPPLHLMTDMKKHVELSLGLELETGVRQLQRLAIEDFPQDFSIYESLLASYDLNSYSLKFKEKNWSLFLHWLSRPMSPSYAMLRKGVEMDVPLIWEPAFVIQSKLEEAHSWLDLCFDCQLTATSSSYNAEALFDRFFELIYLEQFELLWLFTFCPDSTSLEPFLHDTPDKIGAEFSRAFFWRFNRSLKKVCRLMKKELLTDQKIQEQWTSFLHWLTQQSFEELVPHIPSEFYNLWPRLIVDKKDIQQDESLKYPGDEFLEKIVRYGLLIAPKTPEPDQPWPNLAESCSLPQPVSPSDKQVLAELIHAEIWRRRLAERTFAFLFDDSEASLQSPQPGYENLEDLLAHYQPCNFGGPLVQRWRLETESWKAVEQYISKSEWHMSCIKMYLLGGRKEEEDIYEEIVII